MESLLASYLIKHRNCPLPGIGSLQVFTEDSNYDPGEQLFTAPKHAIKLFNEELPIRDLTDFIAANAGVSNEEAEFRVKEFCYHLKNEDSLDGYALPHVGTFSRRHGKIAFHAEGVSDVFFPTIMQPRAERSFAKQELLVGDKTTTAGAMQELLESEKAPIPEASEEYSYSGTIEDEPTPSRWWIWATVLFVLAAAAIAFYYMNPNPGKSGTNHSFNPAEAPATYSTGK